MLVQRRTAVISMRRLFGIAFSLVSLRGPTYNQAQQRAALKVDFSARLVLPFARQQVVQKG